MPERKVAPQGRCKRYNSSIKPQKRVSGKGKPVREYSYSVRPRDVDKCGIEYDAGNMWINETVTQAAGEMWVIRYSFIRMCIVGKL
ncbi:hypothetical protein YDYSG_58890 [Paenibacillus tyrfis]|nr:hypothetical protein YDYSG_58890 [Paenibacillus tyrfis]